MRRNLVWALAALGFLLYLFGSQIVTLLTDLVWFTELGYRSVMTTVLRTQLLLGVGLGILFFAIVYINIRIARRWAPPVPRLYQEIGLAERFGELTRRSFDLVLLLASLLLALFAALEASGHWQQFLLFSNSVPFGEKDPLFGRDIGFYVFRLPFLLYLYRWLAFVVFVAFAASAWVHATDRALQFAARSVPIPRFAPHVKVHLSILAALFLFILAFGYWIRQYGLLQSDFGLISLNGAGYTDHHARIFAFRLMAIGSALVGVLMLVNLFLRGLTVPAVGLVALIGVSIVAGVIVPAAMQTYIVSPNDAKVEQPYIAHNINFTRKAYELDRIDVRPYKTGMLLDAGLLRGNLPTLENLRLWDYRQLSRVYTQQQGLKPYYSFTDADVDRYHMGGAYRQVMLAAREIDIARVPQRTWIAQRLQYTHGYGVVVSPVSEISTEGMPEYIIKDMPPQIDPRFAKALAITRPQIYFGQAENGYAIVNTEQPEFDYPAGSVDRQTRFEGKTGISLRSQWRKLLFALRFGEPNIVLSRLLGPEARLLMHRQVQERVQALAPFLLQDRDPYLVIAEGRLFWMIDAYTSTRYYPYSQPVENGINYLRNSVKVVVDAYDGTTKLYVFDPSDPILRVYRGIFPRLFVSADQLPKTLRAHVRYPEDLFDVQSRLFGLYHMQDPNVFYTRSDAWEVAATQAAGLNDEPEAMEPYYVSMRLPETKALEFMMIRPLTPNGKQNMSAWMAVRCDPDVYGRALVYKFSETSQTQGPAQIEARIQQDQYISQQISLWDTQGSRVNFGNLIVIPVGQTMLYSQPLFLEAERGAVRMPELKQVILASDRPQRVVMAPTLGEALTQLVGEIVLGEEAGAGEAATGGETAARAAGTGPARPLGPGQRRSSISLTPQARTLIETADRQLKEAEAAQRRGDWAGYGRSIQQLRQTIQSLRQGS